MIMMISDDKMMVVVVMVECCLKMLRDLSGDLLVSIKLYTPFSCLLKTRHPIFYGDGRSLKNTIFYRYAGILMKIIPLVERGWYHPLFFSEWGGAGEKGEKRVY